MEQREYQHISNARLEDKIFTVPIGLFFGVATISLIIWNRLIRERLPRDLIQYTPYSWELISLLTTFSIFFISFLFGANKLRKRYYNITGLGPAVKKVYYTIGSIPLLRDTVLFFHFYILNGLEFTTRYLYLNGPRQIVQPVGMALHRTGVFLSCFYDAHRQGDKWFFAWVAFVFWSFKER